MYSINPRKLTRSVAVDVPSKIPVPLGICVSRTNSRCNHKSLIWRNQVFVDVLDSACKNVPFFIVDRCYWSRFQQRDNIHQAVTLGFWIKDLFVSV
ncbi:hypothetical protein OGAPHI_004684 [Ogataea philodendri]|uniref:Uncharacterized protein n=1 Tax=Ogataea philodendri TaxID=1378263 RepID=A0A9P8P2K2_9ASCO|nr:uncharacterized protein OGAPHI_004684 [Ogataea philodendri]KAH3663970.1 hypothetical protein OGAPHI_004684 [Ogataea philodendri]